MMSIKNRHVLRKSNLQDLIGELKPVLGEGIEEVLKGRVETAETDELEQIILVEDDPVLIRKGERFIPLISAADRLSLKKVTVDMGAVPHISDGAHIMAPGIMRADENIEKGEIVAIEDEKNRKIIAIAEALVDGSSMKGDEGKVAENIHTVGDRLWELSEKF